MQDEQKQKLKLQEQRELYQKRLSEMIPCPSRDYEGICLIIMKPCNGVCYSGEEVDIDDQILL